MDYYSRHYGLSDEEVAFIVDQKLNNKTEPKKVKEYILPM